MSLDPQLAAHAVGAASDAIITLGDAAVEFVAPGQEG